jgi:putative addiction module component (TIGR02574 family)
MGGNYPLADAQASGWEYARARFKVTFSGREALAMRLDRFPAGSVAMADYFIAMSKAEMLAELPKLAPQERAEIRAKLDELNGSRWLDASEPLTMAEQALLDARLAAYAKDPDAGSSWEEVESRLRDRIKR